MIIVEQGYVWFEPQIAPPKLGHDQKPGKNQVKEGCLDYSHIMYQMLGKLGTAAFGLETSSASKFCQLTFPLLL
jgi:hypothetical protein